LTWSEASVVIGKAVLLKYEDAATAGKTLNTAGPIEPVTAPVAARKPKDNVVVFDGDKGRENQSSIFFVFVDIAKDAQAIIVVAHAAEGETPRGVESTAAWRAHAGVPTGTLLAVNVAVSSAITGSHAAAAAAALA
jgi:hypothetical protein